MLNTQLVGHHIRLARPLLTIQSRKTLLIACAFLLSIVSDAGFIAEKLPRLFPSYAALVLHGVSSAALDHTLGVVAPSLGKTFTIGASILGASVFALPFYLFRAFMVRLSLYLEFHLTLESVDHTYGNGTSAILAGRHPVPLVLSSMVPTDNHPDTGSVLSNPPTFRSVLSVYFHIRVYLWTAGVFTKSMLGGSFRGFLSICW